MSRRRPRKPPTIQGTAHRRLRAACGPARLAQNFESSGHLYRIRPFRTARWSKNRSAPQPSLLLTHAAHGTQTHTHTHTHTYACKPIKNPVGPTLVSYSPPMFRVVCYMTREIACARGNRLDPFICVARCSESSGEEEETVENLSRPRPQWVAPSLASSRRGRRTSA